MLNEAQRQRINCLVERAVHEKQRVKIGKVWGYTFAALVGLISVDAAWSFLISHMH